MAVSAEIITCEKYTSTITCMISQIKADIILTERARDIKPNVTGERFTRTKAPIYGLSMGKAKVKPMDQDRRT